MKVTIIFIFSFATSILAATKYYDGENRPYEFGFKLEGNQHRHEKKDENGIIMGEFGFITADSVYHVTVYATDEDGKFKVLSMRNIKLKSITDTADYQNVPTKKPVEASKYVVTPLKVSSGAPLQKIVPQLVITPVIQKKVPSPVIPTQATTNISACSSCKIPEPITPKPIVNLYKPQPVVINIQAPTVEPPTPVPTKPAPPSVHQPIHAQQPVHPQQPIQTQQPVHTQQPIQTQQPNHIQPPVVSSQREIITNRPLTPAVQPQVISRPPQVISAQPPVVQPLFVQPPVISPPPQVISAQPPVFQPLFVQPPVISPPPQVISAQPPVIAPLFVQPPVISPPPQVISVQPPVVQPLVISPPPQVISAQPPVRPQLPVGVGLPEKLVTPQSPNIQSNVDVSSISVEEKTIAGLFDHPNNNVIYPEVTRTDDSINPGGVDSFDVRFDKPASNEPVNSNLVIKPLSYEPVHTTGVPNPPSQELSIPLPQVNHNGFTDPYQPEVHNLQPQPVVNIQSHNNGPITSNSPGSRFPIAPSLTITSGLPVQSSPNLQNLPMIMHPQTQSAAIQHQPQFGGQTNLASHPGLNGILYKFNYTVGYHGHHEQGDSDGNKDGGFFLVGRDGYKRTVEYRADENGFQPHTRLEYAQPAEIPKEETEKERGLQGYEFKWFYLK